MDEREYEVLLANEGSMWWFRGLHGHIRRLGERYLGAPSGRMLDAGCGTGGVLDQVGTAFPALQRYGFEYIHSAAHWAATKTKAPVGVASVNALPYADRGFDMVICADVLGHRGVDAAVALGELARALQPGGLLLLNVPAYKWLLSYHDISGHTIRRFSRAEVRGLLAAQGMEPVFLSYWNFFLFPVLVIKRKVIGGTDGVSDVRTFPPIVNALLSALMWIEGQVMVAGIPLPFGSSLFAVARRRA